MLWILSTKECTWAQVKYAVYFEGVQRHPAKVKKPHAGDTSGLWWLRTGECLKMSRRLSAYWAMPGTRTTVYNPSFSLSHYNSDLWISPNREKQSSLDTDQALILTIPLPICEAEILLTLHTLPISSSPFPVSLLSFTKYFTSTF